MNLVKNRVAAFGAAGALAAGSVLAGGVLSPAAAGTDTASYSCLLAGTAMPLDITGSMAVPSGSVAPGESLSGLTTSLGVALPATLTSYLTGLGITGANGSVSSAQFPIGSSGEALTSGTLALPAPVTFVAGQGANLVGTGTSSGTAPTSAGSYDVLMPSTFTFVPSTAVLPPITCTTADPGVLGTLLVGSGGGGTDEKEETSTRAKFLNTPLTTAKKPDIRVRVVQDDGDPAAGVVVVKKGKKILKKVTLNDAGKKRFRIAALPRGEHRIVFKYKGDADSLASKVVKTVRVRRA